MYTERGEPMLHLLLLFSLCLQGWFFFRKDAVVAEKIVAGLSAVSVLSAIFSAQQIGFQVATCLWLAATAYRLGLDVPSGFKCLDVLIFVVAGSWLTHQRGFGWG